MRSQPKHSEKFILILLPFLLLGSARAAEPAASFDLALTHRSAPEAEANVTTEKIDPARTAVVVIDMWDRHWCRTYTARVANLVPRMNATLAAARQLGLQVVFAPSDVLDKAPYTDYPERKAMQAIPPHPAPAQVAFDPPPDPLGLDQCECGPSNRCKTDSFGTWNCQNRDLKILEGDLIGDCNNGAELLNLCVERKIDTLIYMGVASNMCLQHRAFGMRNMRRYGLRTLFVADLVQAITANGMDPNTKQPDNNFTPAKGSALVQHYLESFVGGSFESRQLLAAAGLAPHGDDPRPHLVVVTADPEYDTHTTLPAFAKAHLEKDYRCTFLNAEANDGPGGNNIPGLEALYDADLLLLSMRRRALPVVQMDHLERFIRSGKPLVAIRVSVVPFQTDAPEGHVRWDRFDSEVLGCNYAGYDGESRERGCEVWTVPQAQGHPILKGLEGAKFHSTSWIYKLNPLAESAMLLAEGRWGPDVPIEPVAFTNRYEGARVFYTSLGHPDDFKLPEFQILLRNAIAWALEKEGSEK